eukprot:jgi/Tetstr1/449527/TSEL_036615.t1
MWAVELRAAHTRVVDECGDAVLEDLAGPLASALKLLPSNHSHVARAGCSAAGAEPASAMRSAADLQAIPHYLDFPLHSMRKVQETMSQRIHTVYEEQRSSLADAAHEFTERAPKNKVTLVIEGGATDAQAVAAASIDIEAEVTQLLAGGCSVSEVSKTLSRRYPSVGRKKIYAMATAAQKAQAEG